MRGMTSKRMSKIMLVSAAVAFVLAAIGVGIG